MTPHPTPYTPHPIPHPTPPSSPWHGKLHLTFDRRAEQTVLSHHYTQSPLKVQRPFYPEGSAICHSVILHTAGGIVGGDRLSLTLDLHPQAQALVTTAAAAKVYGSNGQEAQQRVDLSIAPGACLEWLPQETIVFNGAVYRQDLRVQLAEDATWIGWEITRLGRTRRGERFETGDWRSRTEVWQGDRLIWLDPQRIEGGSTMLTSLHGLAGCPVIGSFAFVGPTVSPELVQQARALWTESQSKGQQSDAESNVEVGVTRLMSGMLCRYRGHSTIAAKRWFIQVWHLLREQCLARPGCLPRVWQL